MVRTTVGYAGGTKEKPTYRALGDHTESIQVVYDPAKITYEKVMEIFWADHDPTEKPWSQQYKAILFFHDAAQEKAARAWKAKFEEGGKGKVTTEIVVAGTFWPAEAYHQKYYLRQNRDLAKEFAAVYPDDVDFTASTAAARVNGWVGGHGTKADLDRDLARLGLSASATKRLTEIVTNGEGGSYCSK